MSAQATDASHEWTRAAAQETLGRCMRAWRSECLARPLHEDAPALDDPRSREAAPRAPPVVAPARAAEPEMAAWERTRVLRQCWAALRAASQLLSTETEMAEEQTTRRAMIARALASCAAAANGGQPAAATAGGSLESPRAADGASGTPGARRTSGLSADPARAAPTGDETGDEQLEITPEARPPVARLGAARKPTAPTAARALMRPETAAARAPAAHVVQAACPPPASAARTPLAQSEPGGARSAPAGGAEARRPLRSAVSSASGLAADPRGAAARLMRERTALAERNAAARYGAADGGGGGARDALAVSDGRRRALSIEARACERLERRAELQQRYAERDRARAAEAAARAEAAAAADADARREQAETARALALERARRERERRLNLESLHVAQLHALRGCVLTYGLRPWRRLVAAARARGRAAVELHARNLRARALGGWATLARRARAVRACASWVVVREADLRARTTAYNRALARLRALSRARAGALALAAARESAAVLSRALGALQLGARLEAEARLAVAAAHAERSERAGGLARWSVWAEQQRLRTSVKAYRAQLWAKVDGFLTEQQRPPAPAPAAAGGARRPKELGLHYAVARGSPHESVMGDGEHEHEAGAGDAQTLLLEAAAVLRFNSQLSAATATHDWRTRV